MPRKLNLADHTFGEWTVLKEVGVGHRGGINWLCRCKCGTTRTVEANQLNGGHSKSCGSCVKAKYPPNQRALNGLLRRYEHAAKKRGFTFNLTFELFASLTSQNCSYCGAEPSQICRNASGLTAIYNGVDRVDNNAGYTAENSVACCGTCNRAKRCMSQEEFLGWINRVYEYTYTTLRFNKRAG